MLIDKETIVFDCDSVLLEWVANLPHYLNQLGYDARNVIECYHTYSFKKNLSELMMVETEDEAFKLFNGYNESQFTCTLPPFCLTALKYIPMLAEKFNLVVLTNIGTSHTVISNRKFALNSLYPNCFSEIHCQEFGTSKADKLKELSEKYNVKYFVDDCDIHCHESESVGVEALAFGETNKGKPFDPDIQRYLTWGEIFRHIMS